MHTFTIYIITLAAVFVKYKYICIILLCAKNQRAKRSTNKIVRTPFGFRQVKPALWKVPLARYLFMFWGIYAFKA